MKQRVHDLSSSTYSFLIQEYLLFTIKMCKKRKTYIIRCNKNFHWQHSVKISEKNRFFRLRRRKNRGIYRYEPSSQSAGHRGTVVSAYFAKNQEQHSLIEIIFILKFQSSNVTGNNWINFIMDTPRSTLVAGRKAQHSAMGNTEPILSRKWQHLIFIEY